MDIIKQLNDLLGDPTGIGGVMTTAMQIITVFAMIPALLQCFFGYKMLKFWIAFNGFVVGGVIGALIGAAVGGQNGGAGVAAVLFAIIFGALGAWLAFKFYKLGVFLLCFFMGFVVGAILGYLTGGTSALAPFGVICALIAGIAGVILTKSVVIISTGLSGGFTAGVSLAALFSAETPAVSLVLGLILAALGIFVQYRTNQKSQVQQTAYAVPSPQPTVIPPQENQAVILGQTVPKSEERAESEAMSEFTAGAAQALNTVKDSAIRAGSAVSEKIKTKVEQDNETAAKKAKGLSFDEVCENLEEIFYKNKVLKYIMPFAEYIICFLAFSPLLLHASFLNFPPMLFLGCCLLVVSKQKYGVLSISLSIASIEYLLICGNQLYLTVFRSGSVQFLYYFIIFIELAIFIILTVFAYTKFFASEKGIALRQKLAGAASVEKTAAPVIKVRCPNCGALCDEGTVVCTTCNYAMHVQTVKNSERIENQSATETQSKTTPKTVSDILVSESIREIQLEAASEHNEKSKSNICPQCGYNCRQGAKFCPECGQDLTAGNQETGKEKE